MSRTPPSISPSSSNVNCRRRVPSSSSSSSDQNRPGVIYHPGSWHQGRNDMHGYSSSFFPRERNASADEQEADILMNRNLLEASILNFIPSNGDLHDHRGGSGNDQTRTTLVAVPVDGHGFVGEVTSNDQNMSTQSSGGSISHEERRVNLLNILCEVETLLLGDEELFPART